MVKRAWLLSCCLLFGCTRAGEEDVPPGPDQLAFTEVLEHDYVYNPSVFRGNDVLGEPFDVTVCPDQQVLIGLDVYLRYADVVISKAPLNGARLPVALTMRCAAMDFSGRDENGKQRVLVSDAVTEIRIGDTEKSDAGAPVEMRCPAGAVATALRGGEDLWRPPHRWVSLLGIECADATQWFLDYTSGNASYTAQAGTSVVGTDHFTESCGKPFFALNGFYGRIGADRFEQISPACYTPFDLALVLTFQ